MKYNLKDIFKNVLCLVVNATLQIVLKYKERAYPEQNIAFSQNKKKNQIVHERLNYLLFSGGNLERFTNLVVEKPFEWPLIVVVAKTLAIEGISFISNAQKNLKISNKTM